jgi:hypothetical protein
MMLSYQADILDPPYPLPRYYSGWNVNVNEPTTTMFPALDHIIDETLNIVGHGTDTIPPNHEYERQPMAPSSPNHCGNCTNDATYHKNSIINRVQYGHAFRMRINQRNNLSLTTRSRSYGRRHCDSCRSNDADHNHQYDRPSNS